MQVTEPFWIHDLIFKDVREKCSVSPHIEMSLFPSWDSHLSYGVSKKVFPLPSRKKSSFLLNGYRVSRKVERITNKIYFFLYDRQGNKLGFSGTKCVSNYYLYACSTVTLLRHYVAVFVLFLFWCLLLSPRLILKWRVLLCLMTPKKTPMTCAQGSGIWIIIPLWLIDHINFSLSIKEAINVFALIPNCISSSFRRESMFHPDQRKIHWKNPILIVSSWSQIIIIIFWWK